MRRETRPKTVNEEIERLLTQHYGDGQVYFTSPADHQLFAVACRLGLVSENGQLTARGRQRAATVSPMLH